LCDVVVEYISILHMHRARADVDSEPCFIQLTNTYNICLELPDVVNTGECAVFSILAREDDGATPLYPDHRSVAKMDRAPDVDVELGEGSVRARHMVGHTSVDHPSRSAFSPPPLCPDARRLFPPPDRPNHAAISKLPAISLELLEQGIFELL
jgi:hypothetical protein